MFFETLQTFYHDLDTWAEDDAMTKEEIIKSSRNRVTQMLRSLLSAPSIGTAFAHPADTLEIDHNSSNLTKNHIVFKTQEETVTTT